MKRFFLLVIIIATMLLGSGCKEKRLLPWLKINGGFTLYVQGSGMRDYQGFTYWDRYYLISEPFDVKFNLELPDRPEGLIYQDFNKDGVKDIAVTSRYGNIEGEWRITKVAFGREDGTFEKEFKELPHELLRKQKIKAQRGCKKSFYYGYQPTLVQPE